jgi:amino acid transporter
MSNLLNNKAKFGTAPVFLTAISTILGAVMFLRFGYAVGNVGFIGTVAIIIVGHLVTIPTAMAIAEIATNQKVEGGGEYFIISRSFGINVGASIGTALYLSQAISVAFYIIAFAEAFDPVFRWINDSFGILIIDKRFVSIPALAILSLIMVTKGADLGVKALYFVVATLAVSLVLFFAGNSPYEADMEGFDLLSKIQGSDSFFYVFAIVFPAFTGMTAGVGLSGDLKDPKRSIPIGTLGATLFGMFVYVFIAYKLTISATPDDLNTDQLIMSKIALWGPIIPIGLAAATISSALGSIMVAPRTMQALAGDNIFPTKGMNDLLAKGTAKNNEPLNATLVTIAIALVFVSIGDVNAVAAIISMFFMVTYGAICLISFLQHFAADPSYRPVFKSKWYVSLLGAILCFYLMFMMNPLYAIISIILMVGIYFGITYYNQNKQGMAKIFQGVIAQLSRQLQVFLQKADKEDVNTWRPSLICITQDSFKRSTSFDLVRWISHRYGFGTYLHYINGYVSRESNMEAKDVMTRLIDRAEISNSNVYLDTIISPTFSNAVSQAVQMPSVSGKESNMFLYEFSRSTGTCPEEILESMHIVKACDFDICVLGSSEKGFGYQKDIHIWITQKDFDNASLMILMGFVITGHPEWKHARIKIFAIYPESEIEEQGAKLLERIEAGRLPISPTNIELIPRDDNVKNRDVINEKSEDADLTIVGFRYEVTKNLGGKVFEGYDRIGNILFVNSNTEKDIN